MDWTEQYVNIFEHTFTNHDRLCKLANGFHNVNVPIHGQVAIDGDCIIGRPGRFFDRLLRTLAIWGRTVFSIES